MRQILLAFFIIAVCVAPRLIAGGVRAQDATPSATDSTPSPSPSDVIFQKSQQLEKRAALREQYRAEIEAYRRLEQEFVVAKGQYEQVNTLTALENAVRKTKAVMLARVTLLQVYLELLQTILLDTPGVNVTRRDVISDEITALMIDLKAHEQIVQATNDRDGIGARADEFDLFSKQIVSASQKASSLIAMGRIQNVSDLAMIIHTDILEMQEEASVSGLKQQERDRASKEINRNFETVTAQLAELNDDARDAEPKIVSTTYLSQTLEQLSVSYTKLQQILSYLEELLRY